MSTRGTAETLHILLAVSADLLERVSHWREDLRAADLSELFLTDKVAKRLQDKFPQLTDAIKEKDQGYDVFMGNAHSIEAHFEPFYALVGQLQEFHEAALSLIYEMSSSILKFSLDENELAFALKAFHDCIT